MSPAPWPWYIGALALPVVGLGFFLGTGKLMGVSGMLARLVDKREPELDSEAVRAAMIAETIAQFGPQAVAPAAIAANAGPVPAPALSFTRSSRSS